MTARKTAKTKTATPKSSTNGRLKSGRLSSKGMTCLCGCGGATATDGARFITGHDARLKGVLGRIANGAKRDGDVIPSDARAFLQEDRGMVGYTARFKGTSVKLTFIGKPSKVAVAA